MSAAIFRLPGLPAPPAERTGLNLTEAELVEASGGYVTPARQLKALHARGFILASIGTHRRVVLPRVHYEAVLCGRFQPGAANDSPKAPPAPDLAGFRARFGGKKR